MTFQFEINGPIPIYHYRLNPEAIRFLGQSEKVRFWINLITKFFLSGLRVDAMMYWRMIKGSKFQILF